MWARGGGGPQTTAEDLAGVKQLLHFISGAAVSAARVARTQHAAHKIGAQRAGPGGAGLGVDRVATGAPGEPRAVAHPRGAAAGLVRLVGELRQQDLATR